MKNQKQIEVTISGNRKSGKSSIARLIEQVLLNKGANVSLIDDDANFKYFDPQTLPVKVLIKTENNN